MSETESRPPATNVAMGYVEAHKLVARLLAPFSIDDAGYLWVESEKGGRTFIAQLRGWGYLTGKGHGALGLSDADARARQREWGQMIVYALNNFAGHQAARDALLAEVDRRCSPEQATAYRFRWDPPYGAFANLPASDQAQGGSDAP